MIMTAVTFYLENSPNGSYTNWPSGHDQIWPSNYFSHFTPDSVTPVGLVSPQSPQRMANTWVMVLQAEIQRPKTWRYCHCDATISWSRCNYCSTIHKKTAPPTVTSTTTLSAISGSGVFSIYKGGPLDDPPALQHRPPVSLHVESRGMMMVQPIRIWQKDS